MARAEEKALKAVHEEARERTDLRSNQGSGPIRGISAAPVHDNRTQNEKDCTNNDTFRFSAAYRGTGNERRQEVAARNQLPIRGYKSQSLSWHERSSQRRSQQTRERTRVERERSRDARDQYQQRPLPGPPGRSYYREIQKPAVEARDTGSSASRSTHENARRGTTPPVELESIPPNVLQEARGEVRDVMLQYTKCSDPNEREAREERVRQAEVRGQFEETVLQVARASLSTSMDKRPSPGVTSERLPASLRLGVGDPHKSGREGKEMGEGSNVPKERIPISQRLGETSHSPRNNTRIPAVLRLGNDTTGSTPSLHEDKVPAKRKPGRPPGRRIPASPGTGKGTPVKKRRVQSSKPLGCRRKLNTEDSRSGITDKKGRGKGVPSRPVSSGNNSHSSDNIPLSNLIPKTARRKADFRIPSAPAP